ncbi:hypothetical protein BD324DRAFT_647998 [Kockovaella imperatae]|uniref:Uncharacterized protein n=1 Tax=Kockovaella imperatae TaxID=4999 RepID=A0A1Y1USV9_9TREE|nr:hypothetical protein BD324DRAFT_647998 [Kockovaella imperatae]ORX41103.1 hypothetical protein BD324DRAFT_647998 [Kockovaella imperatae]
MPYEPSVNGGSAAVDDDDDGRNVEKWLKTLRLSALEAERPALLHALVLHLIKHNRHRAALGELETYLPSYPYLVSGSLHTYAGLLCFYLAQPPAHRVNAGQQDGSEAVDLSMNEDSSKTNVALLRQARGWFAKASTIDEEDKAASAFVQMIDNPENSETGSDEESIGERKELDDSDSSLAQTSDE